MDKLTAVMQETAQAQADQAIKAAQDKATAAVTLNVQKVKDAVNATATRCEQDLKQAQAVNTTAGGVNSDPNRAVKSQQLKCDSPDGDRAARPSMGEEIAATGGGAG